MKAIERFIEYIKIDTQSNEESTSVPSTMKQYNLLHVLEKQLKDLGISCKIDAYGNLYAKIPSNMNEKRDAIGFIAHVDTSPDMNGENVNPRIIYNYDGNDIVLNEELNIISDVKTFPFLKDFKGKDIIVTDGTTLLGADDKAGVAIIMNMAETLMNGNYQHGDICIAFTCDEEIGRGTDYFDIKEFGADYAYTVDGGDYKVINYENFNAASAVVKIHGKGIHPGDAKNKMINAIEIGMKFHSMLPVQMKPEYTDGYDGFNHLCDMQGNVEECTLYYIIRNHEDTIFNKQKEDFIRIKNYLNDMYGYSMIDLELKDSYYNMGTLVKERMDIVKKVEDALLKNDIQPCYEPIRGGTDGAKLTYNGLITPNIGNGGYNFHGKHELLCIQEFEKMCDVVVTMATK